MDYYIEKMPLHQNRHCLKTVQVHTVCDFGRIMCLVVYPRDNYLNFHSEVFMQLTKKAMKSLKENSIRNTPNAAEIM